ncbi:MAG: hypothetical protein PVJ61_02730 [Dehalococcoidia bacterium]|jgi:hypothetical protein
MRARKIIIGLVLLSLVLILIPGCKESSYELAHKKEAPSYEEGFVIENPAPIGYEVEKLIDLSVSAGEDMPTEASMHYIYVTVKEVYRGEDAWELLKDIEGNEPAPAGYDYILADVDFGFFAAASSTRWFNLFEYIIERTQWLSYNADGTEYPPADVAPPEPIMRYHLTAGDEKEGWVVVLAPSDDAAPVLRLKRDNLWFMLYESS